MASGSAGCASMVSMTPMYLSHQVSYFLPSSYVHLLEDGVLSDLSDLGKNQCVQGTARRVGEGGFIAERVPGILSAAIGNAERTSAQRSLASGSASGKSLNERG